LGLITLRVHISPQNHLDDFAAVELGVGELQTFDVPLDVVGDDIRRRLFGTVDYQQMF